MPGENKIYVDDGQPKTVWMGRGVNLDDLFLCGYNAGFWMGAEGEKALLGVVSGMMAEWKPTFVRVSLGMNTFDPSVSWLESSAYKTTMIKAIEAVGAHPGTYVLVTLRSDTSMVTPDGQECGHGDDAICLPTSATDDTYRALVDTFRDAPYVLFGVANEPGGMQSDNADIAARMAHAVEVIRAREDALGTPHHLVAVQGNQWTSEIGFYDSAPLPHEGVVYEYHSYPPRASGEAAYSQAHIPVIIGEYGPDGADLSFASGFFADVEAKQIPNLAWSLSPYSNCAPDLVQVSQSTTLNTTAWGDVVKSYLLSH